MADCCITHHTSPCFFDRLTYVHGIFSMEKLFAALLPPEHLLLIDAIFATNNGCTCDVHHVGCSIVLLLARIFGSFGGFLRLLQTAQDDLAAHFVLCDR